MKILISSTSYFQSLTAHANMFEPRYSTNWLVYETKENKDGDAYSALSPVFSTNVVCVKTQQKHARESNIMIEPNNSKMSDFCKNCNPHSSYHTTAVDECLVDTRI